MRSDEVSQGFI